MVCVRDGVSVAWWWVLLVAWLGPCALGELTKHCQSEGMGAKGLCGMRLSNMLSMVCSPLGGFNHHTPTEKRASHLGMSRMGFPFLSKPEALTYLEKRGGSLKGIDQGVTCECCYHMCDFRELREYCVADSPRRPKLSPNIFSQRSVDSMPRGYPSKRASSIGSSVTTLQDTSPNSKDPHNLRDANI